MTLGHTSRPYTPYEFLYEVGDRLRLKVGLEFEEMYEQLKEYLPSHWGPHSWIPTKEIVEKFSGLTFEVRGKGISAVERHTSMI